MSGMQRRKGKVGELDARDLLRRLGFEARRTAQYNGKAGDADISTNIDGLHFEVKYTERLSPYQFMEQAVRDSRGRALPAVLMRSNRKPWLLCIRAEELLLLVEHVNAAIRAQAAVQPAHGLQAEQAQGPELDKPTQ